MPFRTWMYVFAIIGLMLSDSVQAQQQNAETKQSTTAEQEATDQLPFALPVIIIESDESSKTRQSEESERTQREKDDLVAQQGMNTATQAMNEATQSMKRASWVSNFLVGIGWVKRLLTREDTLWVVAEAEYIDVFGKKKHFYRKVIRAEPKYSPVRFVVVEDTHRSEDV